MIPGERVVNMLRGEVGIVEVVDGDFVDYRCLTPKNKPSCCVTTTEAKNLVVVPDSVIPMPRSKEWYMKSALFTQAVVSVVKGMILEEKEPKP